MNDNDSILIWEAYILNEGKKRAPKGVCWKGYKMVGKKKKGKKEVPNCVPITEKKSVRDWLVWEPQGDFETIVNAIDINIPPNPLYLYHGGPLKKQQMLTKKGKFVSTGQGIVKKGAGAYVASDPTLAGAFALRAYRDTGDGVIFVLDKSKLPNLKQADEGNFTTDEIPADSIVETIRLSELI